MFAAECIEAWNTHDLDRVMAPYADGVEMRSPLIATIAGESSGRLQGKAAVRSYRTKGLQLLPDPHFELRAILLGAEGLTLMYHGHRGLVAEGFRFDATRKVVAGSAHYVLAD